MRTKEHREADGYWIKAKPVDGGEDGLAYDLLVGCGDRSAPKFRLGKPAAIHPAMLRSAPKGISNASHFYCGSAIRNSARQWIDSLWAECEQSFNAIIAAEEQRENAIEGLAELRSAWADEQRYRNQFNRMMDDGDNDGVNPPRRPKANVDEIARKYPRAALYLRAESYESARHWAKAKAGEEAKEIILSGGDIAAATAKLENWLTDNNVEVD